MRTKYYYYSNCVSWDPADVHNANGLVDMVDSGVGITRRSFIRNVGLPLLRDLEGRLGYPVRGRTMARDWAVSYYRGKLHGRRVYWVGWSAIEHVFVPEGF